MGFPANKIDLSDGLTDAIEIAADLKQAMQDTHDRLAAQTVEAGLLVNIVTRVRNGVEHWDAIAALPGMTQFARDQLNDQTLDIGIEFTTMRNAAAAVITWIFDNFPTSSPGGFLEKETLAANGVITQRTFTPANTAPLRTLMIGFIATID